MITSHHHNNRPTGDIVCIFCFCCCWWWQSCERVFQYCVREIFTFRNFSLKYNRKILDENLHFENSNFNFGTYKRRKNRVKRCDISNNNGTRNSYQNMIAHFPLKKIFSGNFSVYWERKKIKEKRNRQK